MSFQNRASWLLAKQSPINTVASAPYTSPLVNELVIKTKAIALNPADVAVQKHGIILQEYPAILGCDVAGEVVEVDPSLSHTFKVGDRVTGAALCVRRRDGKYCYSGFQEYVVLQTPCITKIPDGVAYEEAVVLPLGINTAASSLFSATTLGLEFPKQQQQQQSAALSLQGKKKVLIVWGASSSVGACGVQMAAQAGYEVVGVASSKNHALVQSWGASAMFDYNGDATTTTNTSTIVDDIVKYVQGKEVVGAFSAAVSDAALESLCAILDRAIPPGSKKLIVSVTPGAETKASKGVTIVTNFSADPKNEPYQKAVWAWLNEGMAQGSVKYAPPFEVVGKGLEDVQKGVDLLAQGVSAKKLVVSV